MKKTAFRLTLVIMVIALLISCMNVCSFAESTDTEADLIVYGTIYTSDEEGNFAEAFAVKDGRYLYVGDSKGVKDYLGENTQVVEAGFVMPSAVESHAHYILEEAFKQGLFINRYTEDGSPKTTAEMVQDMVAYRNANPDIEAIYGYGWNKFMVEDLGETVTREAIDQYINDIPVYISGNDLHCGWANTKCLELAGALYDEIPAIGVVRDENGVATGRINDEACSYVRNSVFGAIEHYDQAVLNAQEILLSQGYTMLLDPWSNFDGTSSMYDAIQSADESGALKMMVFTSYCVDTYSNYDDAIARAVSLKEVMSSKHFDAKFIKLFADGTEDAGTAYLLEPYSTGSYGTNNWKPENMNYVTIAANRAGLLVHTHAYGDASARQTINAYELSNLENQSSYRNSIAHAPYVADEDIQRIADLGIGICAAGNWGTGYVDEEEQAEMEEFLGYERFHAYYIVDKWVTYGVKAGMSTDRPCADGYAEDVFDYIGFLTTGVDYREGYQAPAVRDEWVSVEDAVRMMTINGAWSLDVDTERGSIEIGKYADFILSDGNPFETDLPEIQAINVTETYFEGEQVYKR